jgi:hypothetical protein
MRNPRFAATYGKRLAHSQAVVRAGPARNPGGCREQRANPGLRLGTLPAVPGGRIRLPGPRLSTGREAVWRAGS